VLVLIDDVGELVVLMVELVVVITELVDLDVNVDVEVAAPDRISNK
jgi:hypothetical protein